MLRPTTSDLAQRNPRIDLLSAAASRRAALICGAVAVLTATAVLIGWALDSSTLRSIAPSYPSMKPNTAVGVLCCGVSVGALGAGYRGAARLIAIPAVLIAGATAAQHIFGVDFGIDQLLFSDAGDAQSVLPHGRASIYTAACITLLGLSLVTVDGRAERVRVAQATAAIVFTIALLTVMNYVFQVTAEDGGVVGRQFRPMALHTALVVMVLCAGSVLSEPAVGAMALARSRRAGGVLLRRLLAAVLACPIALGVVLDWGERTGWYGQQQRLTLMITGVIVIFAVLVWITAKTLDEAARERDEILARERAVLEAALDAMIAVDPDGRILGLNVIAEDLFGVPASAAMGRHISEIVVPAASWRGHPDGLRRFVEQVAAEPRVGQLETMVQSATGREFPIEVTLSPVLSDGPTQLVACARDITDRRASEAKLRSLAAVVDSSDDAIVVFDAATGRITGWNPGAQVLYGYTEAEAFLISPTALVAPGDEAAVAERVAMVRSGRTAPAFQGVNRRKDGSMVEVSASGFPVRGRDGSVTGFGMIVRDMTAENALADDLRHAKRLEAVGQLAGGVAHDFNNLLTVISGFGRLARAEVGDGPGSEELSEILEASARAARVTRELLAFSRRQVLDPVVLDLGEVTRSIVPMLRRLIGDDIEIDITGLATTPSPVLADRGQMEQVLVNLAVNARDAMPGGGTLSIATQVDEDGAPGTDLGPGRYVCLSVSDTGVGIQPDQLDRVFEPFFTTKGVGEGTGLGLATVHGIVAQSGGHVAVSSTVGEGTTLVIHLPATEEALPSNGHAPGKAEDTEYRSGTILLVEDEPPVRRLMERLLRREGYLVLSASTPQEALDLEARFEGTIDALCTDVIMPGMYGPELARRLLLERPGLRTMFVSGYSAETVHDRGTLPSGSAFLEKPFDHHQLVATLRELIGVPTNADARH